MTNIEMQFMNVVPSALRDIAKALQQMNDKMDNKVASQPETSSKVVWYEEPKLYAVTYVGLSDSEYDADGYSEVAICDSLDKAKAKLKSWRDNEIADLEEQEREYEILQDEDNKCRISWCSHGEQVRIEIHEVEMNK